MSEKAEANVKSKNDFCSKLERDIQKYGVEVMSVTLRIVIYCTRVISGTWSSFEESRLVA